MRLLSPGVQLGCGACGRFPLAMPWSPLALTPAAWYRADDLGLSAGTPVGSWTDLSGNGNHATQAVGASKPVIASKVLNGHDTVLFDGSRWVQVSFALAQPFTLYMVTRNVTTATSRVLVDGNASAIELAGNGTAQGTFFAGSSLAFGTSLANAGGRQLGVLVSGGNATLRFASAQVNVGACGAGAPAGLAIGNAWNGPGSAGVVGEIAEILVCARVISAGEITSLESYFTARYGV